MSDPTGKGGSGEEKNDRLARALARAEKAVLRSSTPQQPETKPAPKPIPKPTSKPNPRPGPRQAPPKAPELATPAEARTANKPAAGQPSLDNSFGEIDLSIPESEESLELAAPGRKKPILKKPGLLQDEQWEDDQWAEGGPASMPGRQVDDVPLEDIGGASPQIAERPAPQPVRRAAIDAQQSPSAPQTGQPVATPGIPDPALAPQPPAGFVPKPPPPAEKEGPSVRVSTVGEPRRNLGKVVKVALIVVLAAAAIGGGVYGFVQWRASVQAEEQAQLDALNQGSLDQLKNDALKKEQLGS